VPPDRPRLWDSVKRALGGAPAESPTEPAPARDFVPPFLPADDSVADARTPVSAQAEEVAALPRAEPVSQPVSTEPPSPAPELAASRGPRLARGLASFSRHNADREKRFRHILSDGDPGKKK